MHDEKSSRRPAIWAEGRQRPRFDAKSFARASLVLSREDLSQGLARASSGLARFGGQVAAGRWRVPEHRLGRSGRFLPDHRHVAAALSLLAGIATASRGAIRPEADAETASLADLNVPPLGARDAAPRVVPRRPAPRQPSAVQAMPPPAAPAPADDDLAAIRSMMLPAEAQPEEAPHATPAGRSAARASAPAPADAPAAPSWLRREGEKAAGFLLGHGLWGVMLPWGAIRAGWLHLQGSDLAEVAEGSH